MPWIPSLAVALLVLGLLQTAQAAGTPEQSCQIGRAKATAQYAACQHKALGKFFKNFELEDVAKPSAKCRARYAAAWLKLQLKTPGSSCAAPRFTDNGATVTDNLSGLEWEKKTDDDTVHDVYNTYWWSNNVGPDGDGDAFTSFLATLNTACFAGQCDWRLPTIVELEAIVPGAFPCAGAPCIDPIFGPTFTSNYWSTTTLATQPDVAWTVNFGNGNPNGAGKSGIRYFVRAVRGGS